MQYKKNIYTLAIIASTIVFGIVLFTSDTVSSITMAERLNGKILLQVEQNGESWYVYPSTQTRFYLGRPTHAFDIMRYRGLGITDADLSRIPIAGTSDTGDEGLQQRLSGYILLQVEQNGEAWYVYPDSLQRYYLGRPADAFSIMRQLGLGITDSNLSQITTDSQSMELIAPVEDESEESEDSEDVGWVWDESPPVLTNFMVRFGTYNAGTGKAGDYYFEPMLEKVFGEFGRTVQSPDGPKTLPQMDMFVSANTDLVSPMDAEVVMVTYQEDTDDYEVHVKPSFNSVWLVNFDHIKNLSSAIVEGADILAGQYLGKPSPWFGDSYLIELMITRDLGNGAVGYCPYDFFSTSLKATFSSSLTTLMNDWETFKGDSSIYDESAFIVPGCLVSTTDG